MKAPKWILQILAVGVLALAAAGCSRQAATHKPATLQEGVDQLRMALDNASDEVKSNLYSGVSYNIRYGNYPEAMMAMERIANDSSLNESQKKLANEVMDLLKQSIQDEQNAPAK